MFLALECPIIKGEGPEAHEGHSKTIIGQRLFIFGGCRKSADNNEVYYNDLYILNTCNFSSSYRNNAH
jgi:N-acetylneuraminic acid mutarotase